MARKSRHEYFVSIANAVGNAPESNGDGCIILQEKAIISSGFGETALIDALQCCFENNIPCKGKIIYMNFEPTDSQLELLSQLEIADFYSEKKNL